MDTASYRQLSSVLVFNLLYSTTTATFSLYPTTTTSLYFVGGLLRILYSEGGLLRLLYFVGGLFPLLRGWPTFSWTAGGVLLLP